MKKASGSGTIADGQHEPSRRWTGGGPRPARHIPWPELFKHHQSVLTGHLKMMDMVRKHCVEGTGNYDTAKACVERTHQMMRMFKQATYNFIPPKDNLDKVPLGASSASMYPGYSPADHIYGEAAQEYGERAAELKRNGMDLKLDPQGPQYVVGQNKLPRRLSQEPAVTQPASVSPTNVHSINVRDGEGEPMEGVEQSSNEPQYFVIDSKPTPVTDLVAIQKQKNKANDKAKRRVSFKEEQDVVAAGNDSSDAPKTKKLKVRRTESPTTIHSRPAVPEEDISGEVEARLMAKEEKRKRKEEKKRKRESADSLENSKTHTSVLLADGPVETSSIEKPKKKMHKGDKIDHISDAADPSVQLNDEKTSKKGKKNKKLASASDAQEATASKGGEKEEPRKKRKKDTISSE